MSRTRESTKTRLLVGDKIAGLTSLPLLCGNSARQKTKKAKQL